MAKPYFALKRGPPETWACPTKPPSLRGGEVWRSEGSVCPVGHQPGVSMPGNPAEEGNRPEGTKDRLGDFAIKQDGIYITFLYVVLIVSPNLSCSLSHPACTTFTSLFR
jgi:hypothetical protein